MLPVLSPFFRLPFSPFSPRATTNQLLPHTHMPHSPCHARCTWACGITPLSRRRGVPWKQAARHCWRWPRGWRLAETKQNRRRRPQDEWRLTSTTALTSDDTASPASRRADGWRRATCGRTGLNEPRVCAGVDFRGLDARHKTLCVCVRPYARIRNAGGAPAARYTRKRRRRCESLCDVDSSTSLEYTGHTAPALAIIGQREARLERALPTHARGLPGIPWSPLPAGYWEPTRRLGGGRGCLGRRQYSGRPARPRLQPENPSRGHSAGARARRVGGWDYSNSAGAAL